ncbi:helix-turn-helix transcriptional regulator [uncultured Alistipes sp.]|uniref:helix-turn-helix transcriptional regulator n=1 Tax=uncultured Alistipes sp. TaxID=538949 RepID=UPI0026387F0D|nr:helix-turn-helix transcriptional regulator [uncultured Alistipes sp.]
MQNANSFAIVDKRSRYKDPELAKRLVERIKDLRKTRNIAQETAIDQSRSDIYRYEAGRKIPNIMSIRKICELYNISIRDFFDTDAFDYPPKRK